MGNLFRCSEIIMFNFTIGHRDIKELPVRCENDEKGCSWTGTVGTLNDHVAVSCGFTKISCKYKSIGCEVKTIRKDRTLHEEDDRVHFRLALITVSAHSKMIQSLLKQGEAYTFKIALYSKKKKNELFHSEPFHTSPRGYNMYIGVHANGHDSGEGTHVSVFTNLLEGPFDDTLQWPFIGSVSFELLNQVADENHHTKVLNFEAKDNAQPGDCWGYEDFIPHANVFHNPATNTQYLMDDTLYFRVTVKVNNHKPWLTCTPLTKKVKSAA